MTKPPVHGLVPSEATPATARRLLVIDLATRLAREAGAAAGESDVRSPDRLFYNGVRTAAVHVLRPETAAVHDGGTWLDREPPAFRDGFLEGQALLAAASAMAEPPLNFRLPRPALRLRRPVR